MYDCPEVIYAILQNNINKSIFACGAKKISLFYYKFKILYKIKFYDASKYLQQKMQCNSMSQIRKQKLTIKISQE